MAERVNAEPLRVGSLFSGYGGLDLAVEHVLGARTVWHAEWEDAPSKVLARHWPGVPNYRDVTAVDWATVPPVDVITGGFPCQDVSLAGRRKGMTEGTRSNLWTAMLSAVETIRPRYVVAENVRGLLSARASSASDVEPGEGPVGGPAPHHLRAIGRVLGDLADLGGYDVRWCGLPAAGVGAPHQRFRVFILATRTDVPHPGGGGGGGRPAEPGPAGRDHAPVGPGAGGTPGGEPAPDAHPGGEAGDQRPGLRPGGSGRIGGARPDHGHAPGHVPDADGHGRSLVGRVNPEQRHVDGRDGPHSHGDHPELETRTDWGPYADAVRRWEPIAGPAPAPLERGPKGGERLSPRFTEWMMGLPAGWITDTPGLSRNDQLKMAGNGVVPQQAAAALHHMLTT